MEETRSVTVELLAPRTQTGQSTQKRIPILLAVGWRGSVADTASGAGRPGGASGRVRNRSGLATVPSRGTPGESHHAKPNVRLG